MYNFPERSLRRYGVAVRHESLFCYFCCQGKFIRSASLGRNVDIRLYFCVQERVVMLKSFIVASKSSPYLSFSKLPLKVLIYEIVAFSIGAKFLERFFSARNFEKPAFLNIFGSFCSRFYLKYMHVESIIQEGLKKNHSRLYLMVLLWTKIVDILNGILSKRTY